MPARNAFDFVEKPQAGEEIDMRARGTGFEVSKGHEKIKKVMNGGQGTPGARATAQEILDLICKFIKKNPQSSYAVDGADVFSSAEAFNSAVKRCDPSAQEKAWISEVANKVNMDMDGKKGALL